MEFFCSSVANLQKILIELLGRFELDVSPIEQISLKNKADIFGTVVLTVGSNLTKLNTTFSSDTQNTKQIKIWQEHSGFHITI